MTPPFSADAEKAVLGAILVAPYHLDEVADVAAEEFYLPAHQHIFGAMRTIAARGSVVDPVVLFDELKLRDQHRSLDGGATYFDVLVKDTPAIGNVRYYAKIVRDKAVLRRLIAVVTELSAKAHSEHVNATELLADARVRINGIENADGGGPTSIGDEIDATLISIEERAKTPEAHFVRTGLSDFDREIGGLRGGNLITIAARPGQGKSALALDILLHAAREGRIPSLLFSYEMTKTEIVERALAKKASIDGQRIITGDLDTDAWSAVNEAARELYPDPLWLDTRPMRVERICSEVRRWYSRYGNGGLALVAVDYIGLIESTKEAENRALEIAAMTRALKSLAAELNIPVIAISQLNRESAKAQRPPMISDLRDSGAIEQDSNTILFPYWEGMPTGARHPAKIIVGKNRGGPVGEVDVDWEPRFVRFSDARRY